MSATATTYPHVDKPKGEPARLSRPPHTRVSMIVMDYLAHGYSVDEMCRQYPYLKPAEAHAAMAYYFDHSEEIEAEIREECQAFDRERAEAPPSPIVAKLRAKGLL